MIIDRRKEFQSAKEMNLRIDDILEGEGMGRAVYPNSKIQKETLHSYLEIRETLIDLQKKGLCEFQMDNAADHYEVHFVKIQWKQEAYVEAERLIELLGPLSLLKENDDRVVLLTENEWLLSFTLYYPS